MLDRRRERGQATVFALPDAWLGFGQDYQPVGWVSMTRKSAARAEGSGSDRESLVRGGVYWLGNTRPRAARDFREDL